MVELITALIGWLKPRLWLQPFRGPGMVPLTLADHLDNTCHRPQSRTRRETAWSWDAHHYGWKSIWNIHFSSITAIVSSFQYMSHAVVSQSASPLARPCLWSFQYASLCVGWLHSLHLATSKSSIRWRFKCHFLQVAFLAPINLSIISLLCALLACFITHTMWHKYLYK